VSNYVQSTNFATKDALSSGDPLKIVKGTEINTEFANIAIAVATKLDSTSGVITDATINNSTIGATTPSTGAFTTLSASGATTLSGAATISGAANLNGVTTIANAVLPVIDNIKLGYSTTATAAGTTTLTAASLYQQYFTGSSTQTIVLPVTSTLALGLGYSITNKSTGVLTVQSSGLNTIVTIPSQATVNFTCILITGTTAASWSYSFDGSANIPYKEVTTVSASVAVNALTLTLNPCTLDFRSSTLSSGSTVTREIPASISVVVSNGSTLGTTNAVESTLAILAIDNAGTVELAVVNAGSYGALDERLLISTVAEGGLGAADSGTVIYSTTARTLVAFRIVGFVTSTQATAGAWVTAPSRLSGMGGNIPAPQTVILNSATKIATTSGVAVDFTGIPSWVKRVTVMFSDVSTSGTSNILIQLQTSAGFVSSGYRSSSVRFNGGALSESDASDGFLISINDAAGDLYGTYTLATLDGTAWSGAGSSTYNVGLITFGGGVVLASALVGIRITTVNGTDTFDTGAINILYE
jgi:hypothetical protein